MEEDRRQGRRKGRTAKDGPISAISVHARGWVKCSSEHPKKGRKPHCEAKANLVEGELVAWQDACKAKMGLGPKKNFSLLIVRWLKGGRHADLAKFETSDMAREKGLSGR